MRFKDTIGISYYLRKTELQLRQTIDRALLPLHLTVPKYTVLSILEEETGLTNAELSRKASVTPQTMNRLLHGMEKDGLVKSQSDKGSELKIKYSMTKKAQKVVCDAHAEVNKIEEAMVSHLKKSEIKNLLESLDEMIKNL